MSVFRHSFPQYDGELLNADVTMVGTTIPYIVILRRDFPSTYLNFHTVGGQFVGVWDAEGQYIESGDTGYGFRWRIWAQGSGVIALTQDESYSVSALPAPSIGNVTVASGTWAEHTIPAATFDLDDFLDYTNGIRLGFELTSGIVQIRTVQLECYPLSGTEGWWSTQPSYEVDGLSVVGTKGAGGITLPEFQAGTRTDALDLAYADLAVNNPAFETDPTALGIDNLNDVVSAGTSSWMRVGPTVEDGVYFGQLNMGVYKAWVAVSDIGGSNWSTPNGTDGVDYIRVPGYTIYDAGAFTRSSANPSNGPGGHVVWDDPHVVYYSDNTIAVGDYLLANMRIWFSIVEEAPHATTDPIDWTARGAPQHTTTPASPDISPEIEPISLPSSGSFAVYAYASALDLDETHTKPILADDDVDTAVYFQSHVGVQTGSSDPTATGSNPLLYSEHHDAFLQWDPYATPPGGKLKVRLPDNTWRIVGDEAGSDTERLKLQTPDLTWWKEYRATDGAVSVHPLKLYTADGWVFVGNMTPE
jgi:hypothetical protein